MNAIRCLHCNDVIESKHRHDFVRCFCKKVFVDGGEDYKRRGFPSGEPSEHYVEVTSKDVAE